MSITKVVILCINLKQCQQKITLGKSPLNFLLTLQCKEIDHDGNIFVLIVFQIVSCAWGP